MCAPDSGSEDDDTFIRGGMLHSESMSAIAHWSLYSADGVSFLGFTDTPGVHEYNPAGRWLPDHPMRGVNDAPRIEVVARDRQPV